MRTEATSTLITN